jgi:FkbM family methyltransferase
MRWLLGGLLAAWKLVRQLPLADRLCVRVRVDGQEMRVRLFSYDDLLTTSPDYESCVRPILPPRGGVAVDAGAFIGRYTLAYARAVGPLGRVVAVEPLPANFRLLRHNARRNGHRQVTCVPCALGRCAGEVWLSWDRETSIASTTGHRSRRMKVAQQSLDDVLEQRGIHRVDLLKIDVEGAELEVLEGSRRTLANSPAARLLIEIHAAPSDRCAGPTAVMEWLTRAGYAITEFCQEKRLFYLAQRLPESPGAAAVPAGVVSALDVP